ncbi:MAG: heme d1 biosynthesis radical SAM protein NirJ2 [Candidatus Alkanophagales archaeon]|nr:MAG: heme d1 biosynthesis radical SAM protein NirJ2 [Candidatus Alkanophagales archaeon]
MVETIAGVPKNVPKNVYVNWNVTRACNLRCKHCYFSSGERMPSELSTEEGFSLLEDIRRTFGKTRVTLGGGEPLMRKDIFEIISYGSKLSLSLSLATNGVLLDKDTAMRLKRAGLEEVIIPIDGIRETHDEIRGKGAFEAALQAAKHAKRVGLELVIDPCISAENLAELPQILDLCEELGARQCRIFHYVALGRGQEQFFDAELDEEQYVRSLYHLYKEQERRQRLEICTTQACQYWVLLRRKFEEGRFVPEFFFKEAPGCRAGVAMLCVKPDGAVTPCPLLDVSVGEVRETSLKTLWRSEVLERLRQRDVEGRCGTCKHKDICGGCRARALVRHGDVFAEDPLCGFFET